MKPHPQAEDLQSGEYGFRLKRYFSRAALAISLG